MSVISGTNTSEDLNDRVADAYQILKKSAEDRASKVFGSKLTTKSNEISDKIEGPPTTSLATHATSNQDAVAALSDSLRAARRADQMLNDAAMKAKTQELLNELTPQNTTQTRTDAEDQELDGELEKMSEASMDDSNEGLEATVSQIVPEEDHGELKKMTQKEQVDAADEVVEALDKQERLSNIHKQEERINEDQKESDKISPEEQAANEFKDEIVAAAHKQGNDNISVVVLPAVDLDQAFDIQEDKPQQAEDNEADAKDAEKLKAIQKMNSDAANYLDAAQTAARKLDGQVEELKKMPAEAHLVDDADAIQQDSNEGSMEAATDAAANAIQQHSHEQSTEEATDAAVNAIQQHSHERSMEARVVDNADQSSVQDGGGASEKLPDIVENLGSPQDQKLPTESQVNQIEALAKAEAIGDGKPTEEENKMARDAVAYAESEPERQKQDDAKMTRQQLQDAAAYARQDKEDDDQEIKNIVQDSSDDNEADAGESEDEEELNKLSQDGLVLDSNSADQPTVDEVARINQMSRPEMSHDQVAQNQHLDEADSGEGLGQGVWDVRDAYTKREARSPQEAEGSLQASAKSLVAAVAKENNVAKEAEEAQKENEQVGQEEVNRMSQVGVEAANELEAELRRIPKELEAERS